MVSDETHIIDEVIRELTENLNELKVQVSIVNQQVYAAKKNKIDNKERENNITTTGNKNKTLKVGDRVIITSTYRGQEGKAGTIARTTPTQVELITTDRRERF